MLCSDILLDNSNEKKNDSNEGIKTYNLLTNNDGVSHVSVKIKDGYLLEMKITTFNSSKGKTVIRHFVCDKNYSDINYNYDIFDYDGNITKGCFLFSSYELNQSTSDCNNKIIKNILGTADDKGGKEKYTFKIMQNGTELSMLDYGLIFEMNKIKYNNFNKDINTAFHLIDSITNIIDKYILFVDKINSKKDIGGNETIINYFNKDNIVTHYYQESNYTNLTFNGLNYQIYKDKDESYIIYVNTASNNDISPKFIKLCFDNSFKLTNICFVENDSLTLRVEHYRNSKIMRNSIYNRVKELPNENIYSSSDELIYNALTAIKMYIAIHSNLFCNNKIGELLNSIEEEKIKRNQLLLNAGKLIELREKKLAESLKQIYSINKMDTPKQSYQEQQRIKNQHPYIKRKKS